MRKNIIASSVLIIVSFIISNYGQRWLAYFINISFSDSVFKIIYSYLWWIIPVIITLSLLFGFKNIIKELRIHKGFLIGFAFSFLTVLPMFVSSAIIGSVDRDLSLTKLLHYTVLAGFMEELLFRGFLFGLLFRHFRWGFIPASILGAFFFGIGHLYQGSNFVDSVNIFLVTAVGALWFSWLFIEWKENLWIPILLHVFMNLSWVLFDVGGDAGGSLIPNIFRIITILLSVVFTIIYRKRKGEFRITRKNLVVNLR